jgi:hypothetical protein
MRNQGIIGAVIMAIGGMCPLIHVPVMGNWNYFNLDVTLGSIFYVLVVLALIGSFLQKAGLLRFIGWAAIVFVILTLIAVYFKTHNYFSFIHFKKLINFASGVVKYKWGWFVIVIGALTLITIRKPKLVASAPLRKGPL